MGAAPRRRRYSCLHLGSGDPGRRGRDTADLGARGHPRSTDDAVADMCCVGACGGSRDAGARLAGWRAAAGLRRSHPGLTCLAMDLRRGSFATGHRVLHSARSCGGGRLSVSDAAQVMALACGVGCRGLGLARLLRGHQRVGQFRAIHMVGLDLVGGHPRCRCGAGMVAAPDADLGGRRSRPGRTVVRIRDRRQRWLGRAGGLHCDGLRGLAGRADCRACRRLHQGQIHPRNRGGAVHVDRCLPCGAFRRA